MTPAAYIDLKQYLTELFQIHKVHKGSKWCIGAENYSLHPVFYYDSFKEEAESTGFREIKPDYFTGQNSEAVLAEITQDEGEPVRTNELKSAINIKAVVPPLTIKITKKIVMNSVLTMINSINYTFRRTAIIITGSYARYRQGLTDIYNDIDLIGIPAASENLRNLILSVYNYNNCFPPVTCKTNHIVGCPELNVPAILVFDFMQNHYLLLKIQINIRELPLSSENYLTVGPDRQTIYDPLCTVFSFYDEVGFCISAIDCYTTLLSKLSIESIDFDIPRTIIFPNSPKGNDRMLAVMMRILLTVLNGEKLFECLDNATILAIPSKDSSDLLIERLATSILRLHDQLRLFSKNNQMLVSSEQRPALAALAERINQWLNDKPATNSYEQETHNLVKKVKALANNLQISP